MSSRTSQFQRIQRLKKEATFSVGYKTVYFPFSIREFTEQLPKMGFTIIAGEEISNRSYGGRITFEGVFVAQKGSIKVLLHVNRQVITVESDRQETSIDVLNDLETFLFEELGFESSKNAKYYEAHVNGTFRTDSNPLDVFRSTPNNHPAAKTLGSIVGTEFMEWEVRLATKDTLPNSSKWIDITIAPDVQNPEIDYYFRSVIRDEDRDVVILLLEKFDGILEALVIDLEQAE